MKKILFLIFVILTYIILNNTFFTTKSNDLNIKLNNNEIAILFINNGILVKGQGFNNLLVLNNSVNNLSIKPLNLITLDPNVPNISYTNKYLLNNNKRVNNIDYYIDNNLINIKYSNTTFCILMNNKSSIIDTRECNFLYLYDLSNINNISLDDKIETIFISDLSLVPMHVLEDIYDNEIDLYTLDKNKLTAIKINNNDYNIFVIPNI